MAQLDQVTTLARQLPPLDQFALIERLLAEMEKRAVERAAPKRSLYGLCADLGHAPSAAEIDQARAEAWGNFAQGVL
jgi:hypothetical protein